MELRGVRRVNVSNEVEIVTCAFDVEKADKWPRNLVQSDTSCLRKVVCSGSYSKRGRISLVSILRLKTMKKTKCFKNMTANSKLLEKRGKPKNGRKHEK